MSVFVVLKDSGLCYTFGSPQFGQLGYIHEGSDSRCPRPVEELKDQFIELVACGDTFTVAVTRGFNYVLAVVNSNFFFILYALVFLF